MNIRVLNDIRRAERFISYRNHILISLTMVFYSSLSVAQSSSKTGNPFLGSWVLSHFAFKENNFVRGDEIEARKAVESIMPKERLQGWQFGKDGFCAGLISANAENTPVLLSTSRKQSDFQKWSDLFCDFKIKNASHMEVTAQFKGVAANRDCTLNVILRRSSPEDNKYLTGVYEYICKTTPPHWDIQGSGNVTYERAH